MAYKLFHSDPTTGEVYETKEVQTAAEKKFAMSQDGGLWFETERWHTNPRPHGYDPSNPYETPVITPYQEFPRYMHKKAGIDKDTKEAIWKTLKCIDADAKRLALKGGYLLVPNEAQHADLAKTDREAQEIAADLVGAKK